VQDESDEETGRVTETQANVDAAEDIDSEDYVSDYTSDASHTPKRRKVPKKKAEDTEDKPKDGAVKKAARKIKATAHANYTRLKIKSSKGAKAGAKGKFGRRR
jgi:26S proteasome regulatory subunit N12